MSDEAEATESEEGSAPEEAAEGPSIVLLDPMIEPDLQRSIESELGCSIRIQEPLPLDPDLPGPGDLAIVVPLDLGAVSGVDVIESLRARAEDGTPPIAVTSSEPTRRRVRAAFRAGAATWLVHPYEPEDWKQRLGPLLEARASEESPASDAAGESADAAEDADAEEASA